jgi:reductive dehalogenase
VTRLDERDTMFARMARRAGTAAYEEYYSRRPELKSADDHLRSRPPLLEPGGRHYDPVVTQQAREHFESIEHIHVDATLVQTWQATLEATSEPASALGELCLSLGAVAAGCTRLDPEYIYTHKGRFDQDYGHEVLLDHQSVVVFLVEMDFDEMQRAPGAEAIRESARQYYEAARIAKSVEAVLRARGAEAKAHYDAHYDLILPPLAVNAGLGELGRNNILIADRFGSRVRIGAVTTSLRLAGAEPIDLGADHFCEVCRKCARTCPSHALSEGGKQEVAGVLKWPTNVERCYGFWRALGTDCGICMAVCPFSHRDNWFHNTVRWAIRHFPRLHRLALLCDDLIYGRGWKSVR